MCKGDAMYKKYVLTHKEGKKKDFETMNFRFHSSRIDNAQASREVSWHQPFQKMKIKQCIPIMKRAIFRYPEPEAQD